MGGWWQTQEGTIKDCRTCEVRYASVPLRLDVGRGERRWEDDWEVPHQVLQPQGLQDGSGKRQSFLGEQDDWGRDTWRMPDADIDPPMELWYTEFSDFVDECKQIRDERDRQREEAKRKEEKMRHLIRIKQLKFEAIIKSVEFHQDFEVEVESHLHQRHISFFINRQAVPSMNGYFLMRFKISGASTVCRVYFNDVDRCAPAIINTINRINDMIPELRNTLVDDGQQYFLTGDNYSMGQLLNDDNSGEPFSVVQYSYKKKRVICCPLLPSNRVVMRINAAIRELYCTTFNSEKRADDVDYPVNKLIIWQESLLYVCHNRLSPYNYINLHFENQSYSFVINGRTERLHCWSKAYCGRH